MHKKRTEKPYNQKNGDTNTLLLLTKDNATQDELKAKNKESPINQERLAKWEKASKEMNKNIKKVFVR